MNYKMRNLTLEELHPLIIEWAEAKDLLKEINAPSQRLKLIEECGELSSAILKSNVELQKDAIGDIFVVLVILAQQTDSDFDIDSTSEEALEGYEFTSIDDQVFDIIDDSIWAEKHREIYDISIALYTLAGICKHLELDIVECANLAWNQIKNRTGKTINGTFIKD